MFSDRSRFEPKRMIYMKTRILRRIRIRPLAALLLCAAFFAGLLPPSLVAVQEPATGPAAAGTESGPSLIGAAGGFEKHETVYVDVDYEGNPTAVIVSDWLKNLDHRPVLLDRSDLVKIKNIKQGAAPEWLEDQQLLWRTEDGHDIFYQGTSSKAPPVSMSIRYELDGAPISPAELAGKSGHVRILVKYTNQLSRRIPVKGISTVIYSPFTMLTMVNLPEDKFSNIKTENAKLLALGGGGTLVGYSCPGLKETLQANDDFTDMKDWFSFSADVTEFELDSITTLVTPELVMEDMLKSLDQMDTLLDSLDELAEASGELAEGSDDLTEGLETLADGIRAYLDGVVQLGDGIFEIREQLPALTEGMENLLEGSDQLSSAALEMTDGIHAARKDIPGMTEGIEELMDGMASLSAGLDEMIAQLSAGIPDPAALSSLGYMVDIALARQTGAEPGGTNRVLHPEDPTDPDTIIYGLLSQYKTDIIPLMESLPALVGGLTAMRQGIDEARAGLRALRDGSLSLEEGLRQMEDGMAQLHEGQQSLTDGLAEVTDGSRALEDGFNELAQGTEELLDQQTQLSDGAGEAVDGSREFTENYWKFHQEGILQLQSELNDQFAGMSDRRDAMEALGKQYTSFTMLPEGVTGSVKFVFQTPALTLEKVIRPPSGEGEEPAEPGLWSRLMQTIGGWFAALWRFISSLWR